MTTEPQLTIHWWNMGHKTLDFQGSYKDFLKSKGITSRTIKHPSNPEVKGRRFKIPIGSITVKLDTFDNYNGTNNEDIAIKIFLTVLGDKTLFKNSSGREFKLNW